MSTLHAIREVNGRVFGACHFDFESRSIAYLDVELLEALVPALQRYADGPSVQPT